MIVAWLLLAPIGTFVARYGRGDNQTGRWFKIHRAFQSLAVVFTIIGLIVITTRDSKHMHGNEKTHKNLGISVIALAVLQVIMGLMRGWISQQPAEQAPGPGMKKDLGPRRWLFTRLHRFIGVATLVLAFAAMMIAVGFYDAGDNDYWFPDSAKIVLWVYFAGTIMLIIGLELYTRNYEGSEGLHKIYFHATMCYTLFVIILSVIMLVYATNITTD